MTPLTTPIFDFHLVGSALTPTTTPTPTPSPVKTNLKGLDLGAEPSRIKTLLSARPRADQQQQQQQQLYLYSLETDEKNYSKKKTEC